jgi:hypothetical protein
MSNSFGYRPYQYTSQKNSNIFVKKNSITATSDGQDTYNFDFPIIAGNTLVFFNSALLVEAEYQIVTPTQIKLVFTPLPVTSDTITAITFLERAGDSFTRRKQDYPITVGGNDLDTTYDFDIEFTSFYKNGIYLPPTAWSKSGTTVHFSAALINGDLVSYVEDVPDTVSNYTLTWDQVTGKPANFTVDPSNVQNIASAYLQSQLQIIGTGTGADYIYYTTGVTVKAQLDALTSSIVTNPPIAKAGDTGVGTISGNEWRLSAPEHYFRFYYNTASDWAGVRHTADDRTVFAQGVGNPVDTFAIMSTDVWHKALGNFTDYFFPKTGFLYLGIGSHTLYAGDGGVNGTIFTPPGMVGSWKVMGATNKGTQYITTLILRVA